jgi:acetyl-CoA acetyltransferase
MYGLQDVVLAGGMESMSDVLFYISHGETSYGEVKRNVSNLQSFELPVGVTK